MTEDALICMVEIPMGSRNKYEFDPALGAIKYDRFVLASVVYPTGYGFVPETLALDVDELDVLICVSEPTFPGCLVPVNPPHSEPIGRADRDAARREIAEAQERFPAQGPAS